MDPSHRVGKILGHLSGAPPGGGVGTKETAGEKPKETAGEKPKSPSSLTILDNRSGKSFDISIKNGVIDAQQLWNAAKVRSYDPGYMNTASATSRITWINGTEGHLRYRGYPIEQLAEKSNFLECSFLILYGELPSKDQLKYFTSRVMRHTYIHEDLKHMMKAFRYNAHPMGMLISSISAMSTFHPEANPALAGEKVYDSKKMRNKQIHRLLGTMPTVAAMCYRHRVGRPYVNPNNELGYCENFLYMLDRLSHDHYKPHPTLVRALDILFILHADHELNCSTAAMRHLASSGVDVYTCVAASAGALYGPRHGGANEAVLRMLERIGSLKNVAAFVEGVKSKKERLMGFGHRVYKNYDPRARIVRTIANEVFALLGKEPLIEVAAELERIALADPYFIDRQLYPNVDFYSGVIYKAMGFPTDFFPVLFTIPRTVGWLAHWSEFLDDPENKIIRPQQVYLGSPLRDYVPLDSRPDWKAPELVSETSTESKRREVADLK